MADTRNLILGRWYEGGDKNPIEFRANGTVVYWAGKQPLNEEYSFLNAKTLRKGSPGSDTPTNWRIVSLTAKEMVLSQTVNERSVRKVYYRVYKRRPWDGPVATLTNPISTVRTSEDRAGNAGGGKTAVVLEGQVTAIERRRANTLCMMVRKGVAYELWPGAPANDPKAATPAKWDRILAVLKPGDRVKVTCTDVTFRTPEQLPIPNAAPYVAGCFDVERLGPVLPQPAIDAQALPPPVETAAISGNLFQQAHTIAARFWQQRYTRCGDSYLSANYLVGGGRTYLGLMEFRDFTWTIVPKALTGADRLNGVEWSGRTELRYTASRWRPKGAAWTEWTTHDNQQAAQNMHINLDYGMVMSGGGVADSFTFLEKRHGTWHAAALDQETRGAVSCSELTR